MRFTKLGQRVNSFSEIDGLVSQKDFEMRDELNHLSQKRRKSARREISRSGASCGRRRVSRVPSGRSIRRRQAAGSGSAVEDGRGKEVVGRGKKGSAGAAQRGEGEAEGLAFLEASRGGDFLVGEVCRERG